MFKKIFCLSLLCFSIISINPIKASTSSKIIYEFHDKEELGEYGDETKITLASDKINVLVKLQEENRIYKNEFKVREEFVSHKKEHIKNLNENHLSKMNFGYDGIYVSKYSPYIEFSYENDSQDELNEALKRLESYDFVEKVYVQDDYKPAVKMGGAQEDTNSLDYIETDTNLGSGINVGLLEWGIVDVDHSRLTNATITVRDEWYYVETESEHATLMAAIICGDHGMAPNCHLYSVEMSGNPVSEIDWLVENGVSVVNVSIGDGTGRYSSSSEHIDYIAENYGITFCCAVGNDGIEADVSNMALANNCIAVGAGSLLGVCGYNNMVTPNGQKRPMLIAPSEINYAGFSTTSHAGTSVSTAITTGIVVLLQRHSIANRFQFNRFRCLLMATCNEYSNGTYVNGMEQYGGAGFINFERALANYDNVYSLWNTTALGSASFNSYVGMIVEQGEQYRCALSYNTYIIDGSPVRNEYMLQIYDLEIEVLRSISNLTSDGFELCRGVQPRESSVLTTHVVAASANVLDFRDDVYVCITKRSTT